jgi:enoyl-CoA hydratase
MAEENVLVAIETGVATVTINRPESLNALNTATLRALSDILDTLAGNASVRAVIVTGAGDRAFVAGADILEMRAFSPLEARAFARLGQETFFKLERLPQPTIAAVNGFALGGGCELAMACDIRVASTKAQFGQPEVKLGILPGFAGTQRLPRLVGAGIAKELILTGAMIRAERAWQIGLVNHVVEPDQLMAKAREIAAQIGAKGPVAVRLAKQAIDEGMNMDIDRGSQYEAELFGLSFSTADQKEGMKAFLEKRDPQFSGR